MSRQPHSPTRPSALFLAGCILVGALAFYLRVAGARWSLPYIDHPDEPAVMAGILRVLRGKFDPNHFFYPSLMFYLHAALLQVQLWYGQFTGMYGAGFAWPRTTHFYTSIPEAFVWSRLLTGALCSVTVAAMALWGRCVVGPRAALLGAALLAFSPWAIVHAHYVTVDGPAATFALLTMLAILGVWQRGTWRSYLLAALLFGLAVGTKYQNGLLVVPFVLAHALHWRQATLRQGARLVVAGLATVAVFLLTSPYIVLNFAGFWDDILTLFTSYEGGHGDVGRAWPVAAYLRFHWHEGLGPLPFLLTLAGAVALLRQSPARAALLLAFPLCLLVGLLRLETHFYRNLLPAQPILFLIAGVGGVALWDALRPALPRRLVPPLAVGALALLLLPSLVPAVQASARLARPDTRVVAQEWLRAHYPGVRVAAELSHPLRWNGVAQATFQHYLPLHSADWYRAQGYGLLLANSGRRGGRDSWTDEYAPLLQAGTIVASFGGRENTTYLGPRIDILDLNLTPANVPGTHPAMQLGPLRLLGVVYGNLSDDGNGVALERDHPVPPGGVLGMTAFWLADQPIAPANYRVFVHLRNTANEIPVQRDTPPWQGLFLPEQWPPGHMVVESLDLALPPTLPPGTYRLVLGLYEGPDPTGPRYPALVGGVRQPLDEIDLGEVVVD